MAFHVACPITCRRICDCELGFPRELRAEKARGKFLEEISALEEFLADPWLLRAGGEETETVRVPVPRVVVPTPHQHQHQAAAVAAAAEGGGEVEESARRAALQRQALEASIAAEDYVRRLEAGGDDDLLGEGNALAAEDQGSSVVKVICRICFSGEKEGSNKALKMLPCRICNKKYHMSCLKSWAKNRDLFHWNSWACPSCRICEVCRRAGDPNKLMYCRRCDGAYHCYCQQPPHKNVGHGPYVCPKHTRCHSCGSSVPGSGPSTRWFLGYTCCDACGRLFVKGNYCPVCLKVYRDSETTPMVCCDVCERWVHCGCDDISDEKYQQFQANENLQYQCAACRGDCYQVKDIDDAVRELWRRKDEADHELMASLRASAALPSQDETSVSPNSDDNQCGPVVLKNDYGKPLKFSVKNSKENEKSISKNLSPNKCANKKGFHIKFITRPEGSYQHSERQKDERPSDGIFRDQKPNVTNSYMNDGPETLLSSRSTSLDKDGLKSSVNQSERNKYSPVKDVGDGNAGQFSKVKSENNNIQGLHFKECAARTASKNEIVKGTKLVIHLGSKNRNVSSSPRSETSSCHKEQDLAASYYGSEDTSQLKARDHETHMHESRASNKHDEKGAKFDNASQTRSSKHGDRDKNVIKLRKVVDAQKKSNGNIAEEPELMATCATNPISTQTVGEAKSWNDSELVIPKKKRHSVGPSVNPENDVGHQASRLQFVSGASSFDPKPLLKLKFKNPYFEQRSSWVPRGQEESPIKGQRSKRKRPSAIEKINASTEEDDSSASRLNHQEKPLTDEVMDANWILQKLGKDAIGKRVEVYQSSDRSWCEGVVSNVTIQGGKGTSPSSLLVHLDDGRQTTLELGKQAVRFVSHKQGKRARK